jgi:hypothetical protein
MAKYTRFDPRNKKNGRNKNRSLVKDVRIRDAEHSKNEKYKFKKIVIKNEIDEEASVNP